MGQTPLMFAATANNPGALASIKALLIMGAIVNKTNGSGHNALQSQVHYYSPPNRRICTLLYAAGETVNRTAVPGCLQFTGERLRLKHICRQAIRNHLLMLDRHQHLFVRVPMLGLPAALQSYVLFNTSLADGSEDDEEEEEDLDDSEENRQTEQPQMDDGYADMENPEIVAQLLNSQCRTQ